MQPFQTFEDQMRYIQDSIAMYKGRAVYLTCPDLNRVTVEAVCRPNFMLEIEITDPDLELHNFNVGYFNSSDNDAHFVSRTNPRRIRQGLYERNLSCKTYPINRTFLFSQNFVNMLENKYPTYEDALRKVLCGSHNGLALDKNIAIKRRILGGMQIELFYQETPIAAYSESYEKWLWYPHLTESQSFYEEFLRRLPAFKDIEIW